MSSLSSHTFPLSGHAERRLAGASPRESVAPDSSASTWRSGVFLIPLTIIVAILIYLISTM